MEISLKHIGKLIVEVHVKGDRTAMYEDIADRNGFIDEEFIGSLEDVVHELKTHNEVLNNDLELG